MCERFHYAAHTSNFSYVPSRHRSCSTHATSGVESLHHLWNYSKSRLSFLRLDNLVPFIAAREKFFNVQAAIREGKKI